LENSMAHGNMEYSVLQLSQDFLLI
jgi:hypothetical protein